MSEQKNTKNLEESVIKEICVASPKGGTIFIEAASRLNVPYEGRMVPDTPYWSRCLGRGDVVKLRKIGGAHVKK